MRYDRRRVVEYAVQLRMIPELDGWFKAVMREEFPGISDWMLRQAEADANLIISFNRFNQGDGE